MSEEIVIRAPLIAEEPDRFDSMDPFRKNWTELKDYQGLSDPNARRRLIRKVNKKYEEDAKMQPSGQGASSKQLNPGKEYVNGYSVFDVITPPYNLYQLGSFYDKNYANHAAIDAKVMNVVGNEYQLEMTALAKERAAKVAGRKNVDYVANRIKRQREELLSWIDGLNDSDSFTTTMRKVVTDLESTGNGYIEISRTTKGDIGYVGHIPAATMRVRRLRDGYIQIINQSVIYFRNFGATNSDPIGGDPKPNEIIHLKKYSPLNTYYGVPDIVSALTSLVGDQMAEEYNIDYFENKAVPRYIVTLKGADLSPDSEDRLYRFLQTNLRGNSHRTLFLPLPGDTSERKVEFKMEAVENKVQEASFKEYRKSNRDNILMAHQVPLSKLGSADAGTVASSIAQDRTFRDQVCRPLQRYVEKAISPILSEKTDMLELRFVVPNIIDEVQQATIHQMYKDMGALLPSEIREEKGLPAIEGIDEKAEEQSRPPSVVARDAERAQQSSDGAASATGRNPKGSGAKQDGNRV